MSNPFLLTMEHPSHAHYPTGEADDGQTNDFDSSMNNYAKRVRMDERGIHRMDEEHSTRYPSTPHPAKKQKNTLNSSSLVDIDIMTMNDQNGSYESPPAMTTASDLDKSPGSDDDPDWDELTKQEPAKTDVPIFLAARDRRDQSDERFATMLDDFHASFKASTDTLLQIAADVYDMHREKLDFMEGNVKQTMVWNDEARDRMEQTVAETATTAQGAISALLVRLSGVMNKNRVNLH